MAQKTYVPTLISLLRKICLYIVRYQNTLKAAMIDFGITDAEAKLAALMAACEAITSQYDPNIQP